MSRCTTLHKCRYHKISAKCATYSSAGVVHFKNVFGQNIRRKSALRSRVFFAKYRKSARTSI